MTVYDSLHSLQDYECLLFRMKNAERRIPDHTLNSWMPNHSTPVSRMLYDESLATQISWTELPCGPNIDDHFEQLTVRLLSRESVFSNLLPSNDSFIAIRCNIVFA
jgi:hypothetical protein